MLGENMPEADVSEARENRKSWEGDFCSSSVTLETRKWAKGLWKEKSGELVRKKRTPVPGRQNKLRSLETSLNNSKMSKFKSSQVSSSLHSESTTVILRNLEHTTLFKLSSVYGSLPIQISRVGNIRLSKVHNASYAFPDGTFDRY